MPITETTSSMGPIQRELPSTASSSRGKELWARVRTVFSTQLEGTRSNEGLYPMKPMYYKELGVSLKYDGVECHVRPSAPVRSYWRRGGEAKSLVTDVSDELSRLHFAHESHGLIVYFSEKVRDGLEPSILDGKVYERFSGVADGKYLYVVTKERKLLIKSSDPLPSRVLVKHSSLSGGRPVLAAGTIKFARGRVVYISNDSGHYQPPTESLLKVVECLSNLGIPSDSYQIKVCTAGAHGVDLKTVSFAEIKH